MWKSLKPAIVVTGAASGIGRELARIAAQDGSFMMLVDRSGEALESLATELTRSGGEAHALVVDLTDPCAGTKIDIALNERGLFCDVLVNNAGFGLVGPAAELGWAEQMRLLAVNIRTPSELILRFLPGMTERGRGGILNVGSIQSYMPGPNMALYSASKTYVRSLSAALAGEVAGKGVSVTCLSPGMVRTAFYDHLPATRPWLFKLIPRSDPVDTAAAGWRGFRAGKRVVIPRMIDRIIAALLVLVPGWVVQRLAAIMIPQATAGVERQGSARQPAMKPAVVVTGASSGIGREIARIAAREGSAMMLVARSRGALEGLVAEFASKGIVAYALPVDLARLDAGEIVENALLQRGLYCDVLVNDAGICLVGPAAELDRGEQMRLLDVNLRALTDLALRLLPGMVARGRGGILNLGSIGAYMAAPNMALYHASKAYVGSLSAALTAETAGTGVQVTCLSPGVVRTPLLDRLPVSRSRLVKLVPRSNASDTAAVGWRGFRAGRRLVIPRLVDRLFAVTLVLLPRWAIPTVSVTGRASSPGPSSLSHGTPASHQQDRSP